ncbi:hypothetical protein WR25_26007 [Diploscapter pachys]|uniref:Uncharacterized protein n=1 Tax=Diploscapter pachys TaxID=2018661 RepID=A0A2A2K4R2_9BILA|nr:hypothetical protein WR25_26007 [Diploscapter pachys]
MLGDPTIEHRAQRRDRGVRIVGATVIEREGMSKGPQFGDRTAQSVGMIARQPGAFEIAAVEVDMVAHDATAVLAGAGTAAPVSATSKWRSIAWSWSAATMASTSRHDRFGSVCTNSAIDAGPASQRVIETRGRYGSGSASAWVA